MPDTAAAVTGPAPNPPRPDDRRAVGAYGEQLAAQHLLADGLTLLARNWRCRHGELDLVGHDPASGPGTLVFCEVKTRRSGRYGPPAQAVVGPKAARIRRLAAQWMADTGTHLADVRFDVISVLVGAGTVVELEHLRGAF
ncbi:MAG: YraN family protein [Actinocatenispora sp.]